MVEVRAEVRPPWPYRLPAVCPDGVGRRRGGVQRAPDARGRGRGRRPGRPARRATGSCSAPGRPDRGGAARRRCARMRFALGVDDDLRAFCDALPRRPAHRPLACARGRTCGSAAGPSPSRRWPGRSASSSSSSSARPRIERRIVRRWGRRCPRTGLRDVPAAAALAGRRAGASSRPAACRHGRALALRRAAREVAAGRVDLRAADHERGLAAAAGDPGHRAVDASRCSPSTGRGATTSSRPATSATCSLVGRLLTGDPRARATEDEVRALFAPYGRWAALAGAHALGLGALRPPARRPAAGAPRPAGTPSSAPGRSPAAA